MRSDQLFNALHTAVNAKEANSKAGGGRRRYSPRNQFADLFGYDPSQLRADVASTIPQSLALMNAPQINRYIKPGKKSLLGGLLREIREDKSLVAELYMRCLSREPHDDELSLAIDYIDKTPRRSEAFEDLLWALVNSAEFQYRR